MRAKEFITEEISLPNENSLDQPISQSDSALRNFWNWFKGSKVVDEQGRPLVVYHGTGKDFDVFNDVNLKNGWLGKGIYFAKNRAFALENGRKIKSTYLKINNPFVVNGDSPNDVLSEIKKLYPEADEFNLAGILTRNGHDGVYFNHWDSGEMYSVFSNTQIASVTDITGTYDKKFPNAVIDEDDGQYQGSHTAPDSGQGAPLHDLSSNEIFPDDVYSAQGLRYYGNGSQEDAESYRIAMTYHNKPNALVTIYRSVPDALKGLQKKISTLEKQKAMYMSRGKIPSDAGYLTGTQWYEWACAELEKLEALPSQQQPKYTINDGDWVAVSRRYAVNHGKYNLNNEYSIVSKKVRAKDIFCVGDLSEWGYDPE